eukprot:1850197-Amphidinium_carterae.1
MQQLQEGKDAFDLDANQDTLGDSSCTMYWTLTQGTSVSVGAEISMRTQSEQDWCHDLWHDVLYTAQ